MTKSLDQNTVSKSTTVKTGRKKAAETGKVQRLFYIGPNMPKYYLTYGSVYVGGIPAGGEKLMSDKADLATLIKKLFVPLSDLNKAMEQLKNPNSVLSIARKKVQEG